MNKSKQIIVCGLPRAGSTLLYLMLRHTMTDFYFFEHEVSARMAVKLKGKGGKWCSKRPLDIKLIAELKKEIPNAQFIMCLRDLRSVLCSKHDFAEGVFKIDWDKSHKLTQLFGDKGINEGLLERHLMCKKALKFNPFIVKYEDLVTTPDQIQIDIQKRFCVEMKGKFSEFHNQDVPKQLKGLLNGLRNVKNDRITIWKDYPERIKDQFTKCPDLFEALQFWGYEKNNKWFEYL